MSYLCEQNTGTRKPRFSQTKLDSPLRLKIPQDSSLLRRSLISPLRSDEASSSVSRRKALSEAACNP